MPLSRTSDYLPVISLGALLVILALGSTLRFQAFARSVVPDYPRADAAEYFLSAYNLVNFGVYGSGNLALLPASTDKVVARQEIKPDAIRTPGYPLYLSLFLGGEYSKSQSDSARLGQVILSSLTMVLAYLAFAQFGRLYALGITLLVALSPHLINMNLFLLSETLFGFFLMSFVLILSLLKASSRMWIFFLAGLFLALATVTRPWILGYLFVITAYVMFSKLNFSRGQIYLLLFGAAIVITPWLLRNAMVSGDVPAPSQLTKSIHHGMYPDMMYENDSESLGYAYKADPLSPELDKSLVLTLAEIVRRVRIEPAKYANWYLFGKTKTLLAWEIMQGAHPLLVYPVENSPYFEIPKFYISAYYMEKIHASLMVMALIGLLLGWLPARLQPWGDERVFFIRAASLLLIYFLLMHTIVAPYPRYAIPMRPILYAMALYPFVFLAGLGRVGKKGQARNSALQ